MPLADFDGIEGEIMLPTMVDFWRFLANSRLCGTFADEVFAVPVGTQAGHCQA